MKKIALLALALALVLALAACGNNAKPTQLGTSDFTIVLPNGYASAKDDLDEDQVAYFYKDGYVFNLMATNDEEYEAEVAYINENFDEAVASPFYAVKTNAFKQVAVGMDEDATPYTCTGAIVFAVAGGVVILAIIALTVSSFALSKKAKMKK